MARAINLVYSCVSSGATLPVSRIEPDAGKPDRFTGGELFPGKYLPIFKRKLPLAGSFDLFLPLSLCAGFL